MGVKWFILDTMRRVNENGTADGGRWYHPATRRVPGLWECNTNDTACMYEAEMQFIKDREVDRQGMNIILCKC